MPPRRAMPGFHPAPVGDYFPVRITAINTPTTGRYTAVEVQLIAAGTYPDKAGGRQATSLSPAVPISGATFAVNDYALMRAAPGAGGNLYELAKMGAASAPFTPTFATATSGSISVSSTYPTFGASGTTLSIPSAGMYLLFAMLTGQGLRPDTETSLWAQLYGAIYHSGGSEIFHVTCVGVDGDAPNASPGGPKLSNSGTGTICLPYTATGAETLELYTARSGGTTWSTSNVSGTIGYLKLS